MHKHTFTINRNGDTANTIKQGCMTVTEACLMLDAALGELMLSLGHGRNYPNGDASTARDDIWEARKQVQTLREWAISGAARAIRQREGF